MFDLITFPTCDCDTVELYIGSGDDYFEIADWLTDNYCRFVGDVSSLWHTYKFPDADTKARFLERFA
jgi:hypothetical protein